MTRARIDAAAKALSPEDQSLAAYRLRGITANHSEWIRASRVRSALRGQWFKLFHEVGPRYANRPGGYTRIYKLAKVRQGDAAPMAVLALLGEDEQVAKAPTRPAVVPAAK